MLLDVWEWVKGKLITEEIKILLTTDGMGLTTWHLAAERGLSLRGFGKYRSVSKQN